MNEFFAIYNRLRRNTLQEASVSVDSNRDVTSRGNAHNDKTLVDPNTRDKILQARVQEIEAFAKDRGIDPLVVLGVAEATLRTGRVPNLSMYGLGGDNAVAVKHFVAGEILNLAGMEAVNWDGTKIEEALDLDPAMRRLLDDNLQSTARKLSLQINKQFGDREDARHVSQEARSFLLHIMRGGKPDEFQPARGGLHAQDYVHAAHKALTANQNRALDTLTKMRPTNPEHEELLPHVDAAHDRLTNFLAVPPARKVDRGGRKGELGVPTELERRGKHAAAGEYGVKRKGGNVGGPAMESTVDSAMPSDRNASPTGGTSFGSSMRTMTAPPEPGKKQIQGNLAKSSIDKVKKGMAEVGKANKGPSKPTELTGLTDKQVKKLGYELGALNTGESMDANEKALLNIEPDDPRNESWPKISPELKRLLNLESRGLFMNAMNEAAGVQGKRHKAVSVRPMATRDVSGRKDAAKQATFALILRHVPAVYHPVVQDMHDNYDVPMHVHLKKHYPHLDQAGLEQKAAQVHHAVANALDMIKESEQSNAEPQVEATMSTAVGQVMSMAGPVVGRPNQIASFDASVDVNGYKPARLGMVMANPIKTVEQLVHEGTKSGGYPFEAKTAQYRKHSDDELAFAHRDAVKAAEAMKGHDPEAEGWYQDDAATIAKVRAERAPKQKPKKTDKALIALKTAIDKLRAQ